MGESKPKKGKKSPAKKAIAFVTALGVLTIAGFMISSSVQEIINSFKLNNELKAAQQQYDTVKQEQEALSLEKTRLQDPEYVQNYARGTHLVSSENEQVFILVQDE